MRLSATRRLVIGLVVAVMGTMVWATAGGAQPFPGGLPGGLPQCMEDLAECESACGNGTVEAWEDCDAGNLNDKTCEDLGYANGDTLLCGAGCTFDTIACNRTVYVTSARFDGNIVAAANGDPYNCNVSDGLLAGDCICRYYADQESIAEPVMAWLSDGTDSPNSRFVKPLGGYYNTQGTVVAHNYFDLIDGTLANPITWDEKGQTDANHPFYWTGTSGDGQSQVHTCNGWTSPPPDGAIGIFGRRDCDGNVCWTSSTVDLCETTFAFGREKAILCIGQ